VTQLLDPSADARPAAVKAATCRFCDHPLTHTFVDLGMSPLCESFVPAAEANAMEAFFPLHVWVCEECFLVQLEEYVDPRDIFTEYAYFSSYSSDWVEHARKYAEDMIERLGLGAESRVVELASNDGYLLQHFVQRGVPVLGIEPAANVAPDAEARGVTTLVEFFDEALAHRLVAEGVRADLIVANNVLAQVPDLNTFVAGMKVLLAPGGVVTVEFPHLMNLVEQNQFDTIYHEHFSYFSLLTAERIFERHGLTVFDVEELWSHGGSLRIYAGHTEEARPRSEDVVELHDREVAAGYDRLETYLDYTQRVVRTKHNLLAFLIQAKAEGKTVAAYGAPGKGNTLLNYCGIRTDFLDYACDRNPYKHGRLTPGTHIPICPPEQLAVTKPDYVLILPWNLRDEIVAQLAYVREWGGKFVVPIPEVEVIP
jgi:SAM-dependent methyltransferase